METRVEIIWGFQGKQMHLNENLKAQEARKGIMQNNIYL
jgi:hypothetical protein